MWLASASHCTTGSAHPTGPNCHMSSAALCYLWLPEGIIYGLTGEVHHCGTRSPTAYGIAANTGNQSQYSTWCSSLPCCQGRIRQCGDTGSGPCTAMDVGNSPASIQIANPKPELSSNLGAFKPCRQGYRALSNEQTRFEC